MPLMLYWQIDTRDYVDLDTSSDIAKQLHHARLPATEEQREMRHAAPSRPRTTFRVEEWCFVCV